MLVCVCLSGVCVSVCVYACVRCVCVSQLEFLIWSCSLARYRLIAPSLTCTFTAHRITACRASAHLRFDCVWATPQFAGCLAPPNFTMDTPADVGSKRALPSPPSPSRYMRMRDALRDPLLHYDPVTDIPLDGQVEPLDVDAYVTAQEGRGPRTLVDVAGLVATRFPESALPLCLLNRELHRDFLCVRAAALCKLRTSSLVVGAGFPCRERYTHTQEDPVLMSPVDPSALSQSEKSTVPTTKLDVTLKLVHKLALTGNHLALKSFAERGVPVGALLINRSIDTTYRSCFRREEKPLRPNELDSQNCLLYPLSAALVSDADVPPASRIATVEFFLSAADVVAAMPVPNLWRRRLPGVLSHALAVAASCGRVDAVTTLLRHPSVNPAYGNQAALKGAVCGTLRYEWQEMLYKCTPAERLSVVTALLADPRVDPSAHFQTVLCWAASHGHADLVASLLRDARIDPAMDDQVALRYGAKFGHAEVVAHLLSHARVDPSISSQVTLILAARCGHADVVSLLLNDPRVTPAGILFDKCFSSRAVLEVSMGVGIECPLPSPIPLTRALPPSPSYCYRMPALTRR